MSKPGAVATARMYWDIEALGGTPTLWTEADYHAELAAPESRVFQLWGEGEEAHRLEGFIFFRPCGAESLEIIHLAVATKGGGQGNKLMETFLLEQKKAYPECRHIDLEVSVGNERAHRLYLRHGFVEVGRRKKYYRDQSDALLMRLLLKGSD